ncbi:prevent-host-death protein [Clostridia bacterium]|nr:prevent-host-death protein [Clostridia bacterium]
MTVTATEFKTNIGKYLTLVDNEDVLITNNGKSVAKLTNIRDGKMAAIRSLRGVLKGTDLTHEKIRAERLARYNASAD